MEPWDVVVIGGGILGTSVSYWLANQYDARIAVLEKEENVAVHTSHRNTGVVHRPFYLDPKARRVFARSSQTAYGMWKAYARDRKLPWSPVGTFEVATRPEDVKRVEKYYHWGLENGMGEDELELLTSEEVRKYEPNVRCFGAIWSKTDTGVDYQLFTRYLRRDAEEAGVEFLLGFDAKSIAVGEDLLTIHNHQGADPVRTRFLINCAGGNSIRVAHMMGIGREYGDLNFRGEYWEIGKEWTNLATHNIYTVARHLSSRFSTLTGSSGPTADAKLGQTPSPSQARTPTKVSSGVHLRRSRSSLNPQSGTRWHCCTTGTFSPLRVRSGCRPFPRK